MTITMAKKKTKEFDKNQLLSLFVSKNYQKVISKIKQFTIKGVSDEQLREVELECYEKLAASNFENGDINRAIRDIESLLKLDESEKYKLIKLKYLCYMENYQMAIEFAKDLIVSKNANVKKDAIFLYLLANVYHGDYELELEYLKHLTVAKKNYVLAMRALFKEEMAEALKFLELSNPRAKIEKENIQAIQAILSHQELQNSDMLKPLYRFFIFADTTNLQNTKATREIQKEIVSKFSKEKENKDIKNLIALKSSIPIKSIIDKVSDKELQTKLIYNNIMLLVEKQNDREEALKLFVKYRNDLVNIVESAHLLIILKQSVEDKKSDNILLGFFDTYLKLHHKKLASFQKDFIFVYLFNIVKKEATSDLIKEYKGEHIIFLLSVFPFMDKYEASNQAQINAIMKKYSALHLKLIASFIELIDSTDEEFDILKDSAKEQILNRVTILLDIMKNLERPHKNYKATIMHMLSVVSKFIQQYDFKENEKVYLLASETVNYFVDYYNIDKKDMSKEVDELFASIKKKKSVRIKTKKTEENIFDMMKKLMKGFDGDEDFFDDEEFDYGDGDEDDEEYFYDEDDEEYLDSVKEMFIEALKDKKDPFATMEELKIVPHMVFDFILDLLAQSVKYNVFKNIWVAQLLEWLDMEIAESEYRDVAVQYILKYAKKDANVASLFFEHILISVESQKRESLWYLKWLEAYTDLVDDYDLGIDKLYQYGVYHFIFIQDKKKFKALSGAKRKKMFNKYKKLEALNA